MCRVRVQKDIMDPAFVIANAVMNRQAKFDIDELRETNTLTRSYSDQIIVHEINKLIDLGIVYKDEGKYAARSRSVRWGGLVS